MSTIKTRLAQNTISCTLSKYDMKSLSVRLEEQLKVAVQLEEANYSEQDKNLDNYEALANGIRAAFILYVKITGSNGEELYGSISDVFDSPNYPDIVTSMTIISDTYLKVDCNYTPRNRFFLYFDFNKPRLLDFSIMPSMPTPNKSNFEVEGYDSNWVNGVYSEIENFLQNRRKAHAPLHAHSVYDFFLWTIGFPVAFYMCFRLQHLVECLFEFNSFVKGAIYFYLGYFTLISLRVVFHYFRWAFPKVEYDCKFNNSIKHRFTLASISLGIIGTLIVDIARIF